MRCVPCAIALGVARLVFFIRIQNLQIQRLLRQKKIGSNMTVSFGSLRLSRHLGRVYNLSTEKHRLFRDDAMLVGCWLEQRLRMLKSISNK